MSFFTPNYEKPGPGISKDAPPKKGLALFFEILIREFWQLIKLNLIFAVSCLPIVTIGPAVFGLTTSISKMVRDVPNDVLYDFKKGFRENLPYTIFGGLAALILFSGSYLGFMLYEEYPILQTVCLVLLILLTSVCIYLMPMLTSVDLTPAQALRNAILLSVLRFYHSIPVAVFCLLYIGFQITLFPFSLPVSVFLGFSIPGFVSCFAAWSGINRYIVKVSESDDSHIE